MAATQCKSTPSINQDLLEKMETASERGYYLRTKENEEQGKKIKKEETGRGQKNEGKEDQVIKWQRKRKRRGKRKREDKNKTEDKEVEERRGRETGGGEKEEE